MALNISSISFYEIIDRTHITYVLETTYFLHIFSFHLLDKLLHAGDALQQCIHAYASLLLIWLQMIHQYSTPVGSEHSERDLALLYTNIAHHGLSLCVLLPSLYQSGFEDSPFRLIQGAI